MRLTMYSQHKFLSVEPGPFLVTKVVVQNVSRWRLLQAFFTGILKGAWPPTSVLLILLLFPLVLMAQTPEERVTVPKSMLTQDQLNRLQGKDIRENVSAWAGVGKEVGEAVNSSMQAVTTQSNNFAQTGVGKLTIALVVWRILGSEIIHVAFGLLFTGVGLTMWIWSYRKTCMTRRIRTGKDTWQVVEYDKNKYKATSSGDINMTPRIAHTMILVGMVVVDLFIVFSY